MKHLSILILSTVSVSLLVACGDGVVSSGESQTSPSVEVSQPETVNVPEVSTSNIIINSVFPQPDDTKTFSGNGLYVGTAAPASDMSKMARIADQDIEKYGTYDPAQVDLTAGTYTLDMLIGVGPDRAEDVMVRLRYDGESEKPRRADVIISGDGSIVRDRGDVTDVAISDIGQDSYRTFSASFTVPQEYTGSYTIVIYPAVGRGGELMREAIGEIAVGRITLTRSN